MIIVEINGVEYQVNITPTLNLTVNNTKYPKVVRGDFFVNGQVLDQDGALISNVTSGQIITVNTGESLTELWEASTQAEKIALYIALSNEDLIALYLALSDAQRLVMQGGLSSGQLFTLYDGLSDAQRITLFNGLTSAQKDAIAPLAYNYPLPTGQITSYANFDDADLENGTNQIWQTVRQNQPIWGRKPRLGADIYTLLDFNIHGNLLRFTLEDGGEPALATGGQLVQDHYLGIDFITGPTALNYTFSTIFTFVESLSFQGHSDYHVGNYHIAELLTDKGLSARVNKYENRTALATSSTVPSSILNLFTSQSNVVSRVFLKSASVSGWLIYRIR